MKKAYWDITTIESRRAAGTAGYVFVAVLEGPGPGPIYVQVPGEALLCYYAIQIALLARGGIIYRYPGCEGRTPAHADEVWRGIVANILRPITDADSNPKALN